MKKHTLVLIILAIVIGFAAFWIFGTNKAAAPTDSTTNTTSTNVTKQSSQAGAADTGSDAQGVQKATITYENDTFTPSKVTLAAGGTITWINKSGQDIEIGSDPHPTHNGNREVTNGEFVLRVPADSQATSQLTTPGQHGFHNHLNPSSAGVITVK